MTISGDGAARLLSVKDAQAVLGGISRTTIEKLIEDGFLQRVNIGTRTMITSVSRPIHGASEARLVTAVCRGHVCVLFLFLSASLP